MPERRQLTVLLCDLVDSTRLAAGMDPEEWREVVRGYQEAAVRVLDRFGGHVAQYQGDGLLVYFGWPRAHEDDPERAVRAALGIVDTVRGLRDSRKIELAVRAGLHTGPVVVGRMGGGPAGETLAMGETANVAARLQGVAEPETVVLSSATLRLVSGIFVTRDRGPHLLKGLAEPICVHQAVQPTGVRSRLDVMAAAELTPFVGREQELGLLEDRYAQVIEGNGHAVLICGEAGIGKSRLVQAFRERIAERAHTWLECRGSPYARDSAFHPVLELHRQGLGFRPQDAAETKRERIEAGLAAVGFDPAETLPVLASLHGISLGERFTAPKLSPEGMRRKTLGLLVEWLLRLGQRQPLVLLLEDLNWMDPSTLELIGGILEQVPRAPVLLLATYRPDFEPPWGSRSFLTPMLLTRFTRAGLAVLVREAARGHPVPDAWVDEILRRADGVPLFAEELTRAAFEMHPEPLREGGRIPALQIPDTLQDSLMARLDALGLAKEVAQLGSVLGREFGYELLLEVSLMKEADLQSALRAALREEILYQRGTPPDATYLFKHALIRDVAYQSMLRATRQRHHRRVAETLIERLPEVAEAQPELVAHHWSQAGEAETAVAWWIQSAGRAIGRAGYAEAIAYTRRGHRLLSSIADGAARRAAELRLQMLLGESLAASRGWGHPDAREAWEGARSLCDPESSPLQSAAIAQYLASAKISSGDLAGALALYSEVRGIGKEHAVATLEAAGVCGAGAALLCLGKVGDASASLGSAIGLAASGEPGGDPGLTGRVEIQGWSWSAWAHWARGFPDRSRASVATSIERARALSHPFPLCYALAWGAVEATMRRDWESASRLGSEAAELAVEQGLPLMAAIGRMSEAAGAYLGRGEEPAIARYAGGVADAAATGNRVSAGTTLGLFARILTAAGRVEEAAQQVEDALALSRSTGERFFLAELRRLGGEIALARDGSAQVEAEALFRQAIGIARSQEAKSLELRATSSLARLWRGQDRRADARDLLQPVYDWFTEGFETQDLKDARVLLEELGA